MFVVYNYFVKYVFIVATTYYVFIMFNYIFSEVYLPTTN